jgi:(2Fe-2S) ferredoxin
MEPYDREVEMVVRFEDGRAIVTTFLEGRMVERELYNQHGEIVVIPSQP